MLAWSCERNSYTFVSTYLRAPMYGKWDIPLTRSTRHHATYNRQRAAHNIHECARTYEVPVTPGTTRHYSPLPCPTVLLHTNNTAWLGEQVSCAEQRARSFPRVAARGRVGAQCLLMDTRTLISTMRTLVSIMSAFCEPLL